jgi:hypothetical protein
MPALPNHRQERFCHLVKQGVPAIRAYPMAGYNAHRSAPARLCGNVRIKRRIAEITKGLAAKTRVTVEMITDQLDEDRAFARRLSQPAAAHAATISKARLHGLLVDRKETGAPGDFGALQTTEEVLAVVARELGAEAAAALGAALEKRETEPPEVEQLAIDATTAPGDMVN